MAADEDEAKGGATADGTRSQPDDKVADRRTGSRQRQPVTIDLAAEEIRAKAASAESVARPEPPKSRDTAESSRPSGGRRESDKPGAGAQMFRSAAARALAPDDGSRRSALAGIAGGLAALIVVILLQAIGVLPAPGRSAANQAIEQAKTASDASAGLERRLTAVEAMTESIPEMRTEIRGLTERTAALEGGRATLATHSEVEAVATSIAALGEKIASVPPTATRDDIAALTERIARVEVTAAAGGGGAGAATEAIASLTSQLANAEAQVRSLTDRIAAAEAKVGSAGGSVAGAEGALRAVAIAALRRAADGDKPFANDVDLVSALGVAGDEVTTLRPIAEKGVPASAALAAEFPRISDAILSATSANDPNAGFWQRVKDGLSSLVAIRPTGPVAGNDPAAIVSRMADDVAKSDLAAALTERESLPQAGKQASAEWAAKAGDRVALDALVERIARAFDTPNAG
jgi:hypothetical protein